MAGNTRVLSGARCCIEVRTPCRRHCLLLEGVADVGGGGPRHAVQGLPCAAEMQLQCVSERRGRGGVCGWKRACGMRTIPGDRNSQHSEQNGRTLAVVRW